MEINVVMITILNFHNRRQYCIITCNYYNYIVNITNLLLLRDCLSSSRKDYGSTQRNVEYKRLSFLWKCVKGVSNFILDPLVSRLATYFSKVFPQ